MFGNDYRTALLSAVLSVDPEDLAARNSIDWMRAHLPRSPPRRGADRRRRPHGTDQGLRRPGVEDRALVFGFVALIAFVMLLISIRSVFLAFRVW